MTMDRYDLARAYNVQRARVSQIYIERGNSNPTHSKALGELSAIGLELARAERLAGVKRGSTRRELHDQAINERFGTEVAEHCKNC